MCFIISHDINKILIFFHITSLLFEKFVTAKIEWQVLILDVDMGEALGLLCAMKWVIELNPINMANNIYGKNGVSDFIAIIDDCRQLLGSELMNSNVNFIRRQVNDVAHGLAKEAPHNASLHYLS